MLLLRQLSSILLTPVRRTYAKRISRPVMASLLEKRNERQVHQETMRIIHPFARINVNSDTPLRVKCADLHEYPDANVLIAELYGGQERNCTATMEVLVAENKQQVDIVVKKLASKSDFYCELSVPVRADLHIDVKDNVSVRNIFSSKIRVHSQKNIKAKELRADDIQLHSTGGDINCVGLLLGRKTIVETKQKGNISFDKLQGDNLWCKTDGGTIKTNSCYVEASRFETNVGVMKLKNVHKSTEVYVHQNGDLNMTGVHGKLFIHSNGGKLNVQLSEITDESTITIKKVEKAEINISENIEKQTSIEVTSEGIILDGTLEHLSQYICSEKKLFRMLKETDAQSKLIVNSNGGVKLGKLSWMDTLRTSMSSATDDKKLE